MRQSLEPRFGADFGGVRIHTDALAGASARAIGADAFTYGDSIAFGPGLFAPDTVTGTRLLAHELTHVLQQRRGAGVASPGPTVHAAPVGFYRSMAGNCFIPGRTSSTIGTFVHEYIQDELIALYGAQLFAEVSIPGGGTTMSATGGTGRADLFATAGPGATVPAVPQRCRPTPASRSPPTRPLHAEIGSIKPASSCSRM